MSAKPRRDRRVTTLRGALRQLSRHCRICADELNAAIDSHDTEWLATTFRLLAVQVLLDLETIAELAARQPEPPAAVYEVMGAGAKFMASLCDIAGLPTLKQEILATLEDCPISL